MSKIKLSFLLFLVTVLSSGVFLSCANAFPLAQNGLAYITLEADFPFPTTTAEPTPTDEPTVTPTPTPRPEPTARPTLEINCRSAASVGHPKVEVYGRLTYNETAIPSASIYVGFSVDNGERWENFTLVQTRPDGTYTAIWIPNATGNYLVSASWVGNWTLHWVNATASLALTPDSSGNLFSVVSNSTVTDFAYDAETHKISFNTNGTSNTQGYFDVCIPQALISDVTQMQVSIDGHPVEFNSESQEDIWVISCLYSQSAHAVTVQIPSTVMPTLDSTPWTIIYALVGIVALIVVVALALVVRRRRKTAATVAAILKEKRPMY
jgi:hypothetical protein